MSLEQLENTIRSLLAEERQRLVLWFEENRSELLGDEADELGDPPSPSYGATGEQKAEIVRRRDLAVAHRELLEPWDGAIERARAANAWPVTSGQ